MNEGGQHPHHGAAFGYKKVTSYDGSAAAENRNKQNARENEDSESKSKFNNIRLTLIQEENNHTRVSPGTNLLLPPSIMEENVHNLAFSPVKMEKYFGSNARSDFLKKINLAYQDETIKGRGLSGAYSETAYLPTKEEFVDIPFMPRRPVKTSDRPAKRLLVESLGDVSCLDGHDDRPGLRMEEHSMDTTTSFDYQKTSDYEHNQPSSPRTEFIAGCIQEKLNPRASLLLRKTVSQELNLQHQGNSLASPSMSMSVCLSRCSCLCPEIASCGYQTA